MKHWMMACLSLAIGAGVAFAPSRAEACTGPLGYACGGVGVVASPAEAGTIVFRAPYAATLTNKLVRSTATPTLHLADSTGNDVPFTVTADPNLPGYWVMKGSSPLQAGAKYTVRWDALCTAPEIASSVAPDREKAAGGSAEVTLPAPAPVPTSLGTLGLVGPTRTAEQSCSCSVARAVDSVEALPKLDPTVAAQLAAYEGMSVTELTVDGVALDEAPWELKTTSCNGGVLASCTSATDAGVGPGVHQVGFRVVIAGVAAPLTAQTSVDFNCTTPAPDAGGPPPVDAGNTSPDASTPGASNDSGSSSSCGVTTASTAGVASGMLAPFAALLGLAALRRRNRK